MAISRLSPPSCDRHNAYRRQNPTASVSYSRGDVADETEVPPDKKSKLPHREAFRDFLDVWRDLRRALSRVALRRSAMLSRAVEPPLYLCMIAETLIWRWFQPISCHITKIPRWRSLFRRNVSRYFGKVYMGTVFESLIAQITTE